MRALVMACAIVTLAGAAARAESDAERQARAIRTFERGQVQFRDGRFDAAAQLFNEAWITWPDPAYLYNVAFSFEKAERWRLAEEGYRRFLERYPDSANTSEVRARKDAVARSREAARAEVVVRSEPPGARAFALTGDGSPGDEPAPSCVTPCSLRVDPGPFALRVELGARRVDRSKSLAPGERWEVDVRLPVAPVAVAPDRTPAWVAWGVGGAALITGVVFAALAQSSYDDGRALVDRGALDAGERERLAGLRGDVRDQSLVADLGFLGALAGATVGTVLWLTAEPGETPPPESTSWR